MSRKGIREDEVKSVKTCCMGEAGSNRDIIGGKCMGRGVCGGVGTSGGIGEDKKHQEEIGKREKLQK